jgi:hypothetical protein
VKREEVRERFPESVLIADEFKKHFGQIRLTYVAESGKTMGRKSPDGVPITPISGDAFVAKSGKRKGE